MRQPFRSWVNAALLCALVSFAGSALAQTAAQAAAPARPKMIDLVPADYTGEVALITYFRAQPGMIDVYSKWMGSVSYTHLAAMDERCTWPGRASRASQHRRRDRAVASSGLDAGAAGLCAWSSPGRL